MRWLIRTWGIFTFGVLVWNIFYWVQEDNAIPLTLPLINMFNGMFIVSYILEEFDGHSHKPTGRLRMRPMSFVITVPEKVIEKIGIEEITELLKESKTLELVD